jgi:two-component sensor histidine kinase
VRCRSALAAAWLAARRGGGGTPADPAEAEATIRALRASLVAVGERLREADHALDDAAEGAAAQAAALSRARAAARREATLRREADHRIKNSLQVVASLLRVQADGARTREAAEALRLAGARVAAVAEVHALLASAPPRGGAADALDLHDYLREVCASLGVAMGADGRRGEIVVEVEPATVTAATAQALGLAIAELVANAFRHGFAPGAAGTVWVQGARAAAAEGGGGGRYRLTVADDGRGLPAGFAVGSGPGLGLRLLALVARQVGAGLEADGGRCGSRFTLSLPGRQDAGPTRAR